MDAVELGLSIGGLALSIYALVQAESAKKAVSKVIAKEVDQGARDDARELMQRLNEAREAAMARRQGAHRSSSAGRSQAADMKALQLAQDALATTNLGDKLLTLALRAAADELNQALAEINANGGRDGWADALGTLQGVIPKVDVLHRELSTKALR